MFVLTIIEVVCLCVFTAYLVNEYAQREVPLYVKMLTFISWMMSFGIVFLLPHDIYYTAQLHTLEDTSGFSTLQTAWAVVYWSNFILTWLVLPLFQEYEDAGEFTFEEKMSKSIKNNLIIYGVFAAFGLVFVVYLTAINKLQFSAVLSLMVALANCFGIFLVVLLLGYGLVEIPKSYWRKSQYEKCLQSYRFEAVAVEEAKIALHYELDELTKQVMEFKRKNQNPLFNDPIQEILGKIPFEIVEQCVPEKKEVPVLTLQKLTDFHRKAKRLSAEYERAKTKWDVLCEETFLTEDLLENKYSVEKRIRSTLWQQRRGGWGKLYDTFTWCWYTKLKRVYLVSLFGIFTLLSLVVLLGEISIFTHIDYNIFGHLLSEDYSFFHVQFVVLIPLVYISFCSYYGLFHIRLAGLYGLYRHHHTDAPSLLFGSINFSRISFPLAYNFLQMMSIKDKTPFIAVIGDMDFVPVIGQWFQLMLPAFLILVSVMNFFEVFDKLLSVLGLSQFQFHIVETEQRVEEGKKLLYKARIQRERSILNKNQKKHWEYNDVEIPETTKTRDSYQYFAFQNFDEILKI